MFAVRPSIDIIESPADVIVNEVANFTCSATTRGSGDLTIEWICSDGSNCGSPIHEKRRGYVTSTLQIIGATSLNVTCIVNQNLASFCLESLVLKHSYHSLKRYQEQPSSLSFHQVHQQIVKKNNNLLSLDGKLSIIEELVL